MKRASIDWQLLSPAQRAARMVSEVTLAGVAGFATGMLVAAIALGLAALLGGCGEPTSAVGPIIVVQAALPESLTKYVPVVYDSYGTPVSATADSAVGPVLWLWPSGLVNVAAASFSGYYPLHPAFAMTPKGGYDMRVNLRGSTPVGVSAGWQMSGAAFALNDSARFALPGYGLEDVPRALITGARFDVVAVSDSVLELTARVFYDAGSEHDTLATFARLAHERFGRP